MSSNYIAGHRVYDTGETAIANHVWDTNTFTWVAQTQASASGGVVDTELPDAIAIATDGIATPVAPQVYAHNVVFNGTTWDRVRGDVTNGLLVNLGSNNDIVVTTLPALPAGSNIIGSVNINGTVPVSGTFFQATQPVSIATAPVLVAGSAIIGKVGIDQTTPGTTNKVSIGTDGTVTIAVGSNTIGAVNVNKVALTASTPVATTAGVTSGQLVAANSSRKGLVITNLSANIVSFGIGTTAILNGGITLAPYGVWEMDEYSFATGAINAIATAASSAVAVQEFA